MGPGDNSKALDQGGVWLRDGQLPLLRYFLARLGAPGEAADLAQETLMRAYSAPARGEQPREPLAWLLGIARNVLLEALRAKRYERQLRERVRYALGQQRESPCRALWPDGLERNILLNDAVNCLPVELREPLVLRYFGELTVAEIAAPLDVTDGAVKARLWRARRLLRSQLEDSMDLGPVLNPLQRTRGSTPGPVGRGRPSMRS